MNSFLFHKTRFENLKLNLQEIDLKQIRKTKTFKLLNSIKNILFEIEKAKINDCERI
jgi:hypothetical protein